MRTFEVVSYTHPFLGRAVTSQPLEGGSILDLVAQSGVEKRNWLSVIVTISKGRNTVVVPFSDWEKVRPKAGAFVQITPRVHGPAAGLLLSALLPSASGWVAGSLLGLTSGTLGYALAYAAVTIVGSLAINALIPPPTQPHQDAPNYAITGSSNVENRYGIFPTVLGRHQMFPVKTAQGYTEAVGEDVFFRGRFTFGYGPVALESLKIGTTPITDFSDVEIEFLNVDQVLTEAAIPDLADMVVGWRTGTEAMTLYPDDIAEDGYSVEALHDVSIVRTTRTRAVSASVDISFPGLIAVSDKGNRNPLTVEFGFRYRATGSGTWIDSGQESFTGQTTASIRFTKNITFPVAGSYEIEITRLTEVAPITNWTNASHLTAIRSVQSGALPSHGDISEIAVRVKATDQLSGQLNTINAIAHQLAPVWNGAVWSAPQKIRHPAWVYARALMGPMLRDNLADTKLQLADLKAWADEEPHWTCDMVIDQPTTAHDVLSAICATGRAKRTMRDLKHSVVRDGGAGPVVQQFSPRNSWGFKGAITFPREIHGFRVRFKSEALDWQEDEVVVYADDYDDQTAIEFETLDLRGVVLSSADTSVSNAWRLGRYHLAQAILRPEEFSWFSDLDHLRVNLGDKVRIIHDVPLIGVGSGRIADLTLDENGDIETIVLDEFMSLAGSVYRMRVRTGVGVEVVMRSSPPTSFDGLWNLQEVVSGAGIKAGDLVFVEELTQETTELLIKEIRHLGDFKAEIKAVPASPAVLDADQGTIPDYVPIITTVVPREDIEPATPSVMEVGAVVLDADVVARLKMSTVNVFEGDVFQWTLTTDSGAFVSRGSSTAVEFDIPLPAVGGYKVTVQTRSTNGLLSVPETVGVTWGASLTTPDDVSGFRIRVLSGQANLTWSAGEAFVDHYEIRHLPVGSILGWPQAVVVESNVDGRSATVPAIAGAYLIRAVSKFGQLSRNAVQVTSGADLLNGYNVVEALDEAPDFNGEIGAGLAVSAGKLRLVSATKMSEWTALSDVRSLIYGEGTLPSATYEFSNPVDLSEVYTSRLTASVLAYGSVYADNLSDWVKLSDVESLSGVDPDAWSVTIWVSTTTDDPFDLAATWTDWEVFQVGDYTARGFKFQCIVTAEASNITVTIDSLSIQIDMPDRAEGKPDMVCPVGGVYVAFTPPFKARPAITIYGQELPSGAIPIRTNISADGFHQRFTDNNDNPVACSFDWVAKGYGRVH